MASNTLYPPVVNNTEPAFITSVGTPGELKVYFKFSAFNADLDKSNISVHATVHLKVGTSIVNIVDGAKNDGTMDDTFRLRATQIILNLKPIQVSNSDLWYIILKNEDIKQQNTSGNYSGWVPGSVYKIQIRLSEVTCATTEEMANQQVWLYSNADRFSEWSTVIYTKCIEKNDPNIKSLCDYNFILGSSVDQEIAYPETFEGQILFTNSSNEHYESCLLKVYHEYTQDNILQKELIEEATLYPNDISRNNFKYFIKYNFEANNHYCIEFSYITENKYQSDVFEIYFHIPTETSQICKYKLVTVDDTNHSLIRKIQDGNKYYTSLGMENDIGCVGLKLELDPLQESSYIYENINLRIVRTDENSNFTLWEVIKYINLKLPVTPLPSEPTPKQIEDQIKEVKAFLEKVSMFFDFTIESNIFYKYGIQSYFNDANPGQIPQWRWTKIKSIENPIQRDFEYAYLLGKDQKQLNIKFNNNINSFTPQVYDNKLEPIGSQFPYIYRNSKTNYRTFPITGTISFEMDNNETFLVNGDLDIYKYQGVKDLYDQWHKSLENKNGYIPKYDYGYERKFRKKVIDFLKDGTFKLFKSATEGNILVRLRDINCSPNQSLGRLIYDFSANADEVDEYNLDSLKKYGIIYPGTYVTDWNNVPYIDIYEQEAQDYGLPHCHGFATSFITPSFYKNEVQTPTSDPILPNNEEEGGE